MKTPKFSVTTWANLLMDKCCPGLVTSLNVGLLNPKKLPISVVLAQKMGSLVVECYKICPVGLYHLRILIHKNIIQQQTVSFRRASSFLFICQMMPLKFKYFSIFKCTIIFFENGQTLRILGIWQICLLFIYFPSKLRKLLCEIPLNSTGENCVFS